MLTNIKTYADESTEFMDALKTVLTESLDTESFSPEIYIADPEELECRSRDGFIPHNWNKGGVIVRGFTDLGSIRGTGYFPKSKKSRVKVETFLENELQSINGDFATKYAGELASLDNNKLEIGDLPPNLENILWDYESEALSSEYATIMLYVQAMYEGAVGKTHKLYLTVGLNIDGPYHRRGYDTENASKFVTFSTLTELKQKLTKLIPELAAKVF